jgi:anti-anti-sigma factor
MEAKQPVFASERHDSVLLVTTGDELDARNAAQAKEFFRELVDGGDRQLVIDLSRLSFIDSSGLGVLVTALKTARQAGGDVRLCGLSESVRSIFELTRLFRVFNTFDDSAAAVASFA